MYCSILTSFLAVLALAEGAAIEKRAPCSSYTIISTRGTGENQGPSTGFRTMNANVLRQLSGGKVYNTVYPASASQISTAGTQDIINQITTTLRTSADECFILEGYSQGAAATVDAMPRLTGASFDAVKGVFLIGNPDHKPGVACNVDNNGGTSTREARGISSASSPGIPTNWVSKTLDVCYPGDGVCSGYSINFQHLLYGSDSSTQNLGTEFISKQLGASALIWEMTRVVSREREGDRTGDERAGRRESGKLWG